ncbi:MAG TPA: hypothetical protein DCM86_00880 [Verrucomicrobiales bacterium]|nr:hypothetical protein [Verrucomicrobiales bacterium]
MSPQSAATAAGDTVILRAGVIGVPPLKLQWRKDGVNIPGATSATYTRPVTGAADEGDYDVVATNDYGSATSNPGTLTLDPEATHDLSVELKSSATGPIASVTWSAAGPAWQSFAKLQSADSVSGPYTDLGVVASPYEVSAQTGAKFYRLVGFTVQTNPYDM